MKRFIKIYLFILPFLFISIKDVHASTTISYLNYKQSIFGNFTNCSYKDNCLVANGETYNSGGLVPSWQNITGFYLTQGGSGAALSTHIDEGFIKGNYYSVTLYISGTTKDLVPTTSNSKVVGTGNTNVDAFNSAGAALSTSYIHNINTYFCDDLGCDVLPTNMSALTYTFKAPGTGNELFITFTSSVTANPVYLDYYGYNYASHGATAPNNEEILNALDSSFNNVNDNINSLQNSVNNAQQSIYNVESNITSSIYSLEDNINNSIDNSTNTITNEIDNSTNSINNNIDAMKDKQDTTNDLISSESEDTESSSCGILCKLKGIFTKISNLPASIWNSIKGGFEWVANAIDSLFDSIKGIFLPEPSCEEKFSPNLFDIKRTPDKIFGASYSYDVNNDTLNVSGSNGGYYIQYNLGPVSELMSKNNYISLDYNTVGGRIFICYGTADNTGKCVIMSSTPTILLTSFGTSNNLYLRIYAGDGDINGDYSSTYDSVMLTLTNDVIPYEPYGTYEVCTESNFFGWFQRFGDIIKGFLDSMAQVLLDGIKGLFLPTDAQLMEIVEDSQEMAENFGFIGEAMSFFIGIFTTLLGLVNGNGCITLPEMTIGSTSLFESFTFWEETQYCLANNEVLSANIETIRTGTSLVLVAMFVSWAASKFFGILSKNGDEDIVDYTGNEALPTVTHVSRRNGTTIRS